MDMITSENANNAKGKGGGGGGGGNVAANYFTQKFLKEQTKSEKTLKAELHQLELAKKQYEMSCKFEAKKVINRFTNRIAKHHFYISALNDSSELSNADTNSILANSSLINISSLNISTNNSNNNNNNNNNSSILSNNSNITNNTNYSKLSILNEKSSMINNTSINSNNISLISNSNNSFLNNNSINSTQYIRNLNDFNKKFTNANTNNIIEVKPALNSNNNNNDNKQTARQAQSATISKLLIKNEYKTSNDKNKPSLPPKDKSKTIVNNKLSNIKKSIETNNNNSLNEIAVKVKKNVTWNKTLFSEMNPPLNTIYSTENTEYDMKRHGSRGSIAALNNGISKTKRKSIDKTKETDFDFDHSENISCFIDSLKTSDSGFHLYVNSKGVSLCSGYDNFANLNRFNSASTSTYSQKMQQPSITYFRDSNKTVINHFENPFDSDFSFSTNSKKRWDSSQDSASLLFDESMILKKKNSTDRLEEDENKEMIEKIFKAQSIRNLTLKNVITY